MRKILQRARRSFRFGLMLLTFAIVLCALIGTQGVAAITDGLFGPAPLMVLVLQTYGGAGLLLTWESGPSADTDATSARRKTILRICVVASVAIAFVAGLRLPSGYGVASALVVGTMFWSIRVLSRRLNVMVAGVGLLLFSGAWRSALHLEEVASALVCALCLGCYVYISERRARAGRDLVLPAVYWMSFTVLAVPFFTASDPAGTTQSLAKFAFVSGVLWTLLIVLLARLRKATSTPTSSAIVRYAPLYAPVLATVLGLFGTIRWVNPPTLSGFMAVCLLASVGWTAHLTRR
ncbi:hypothetical protein ACRYCC_26530 [Actinomadura scrupuli]|uniref:hypothetical protein n=1 Tax=Actinomadura scrupuli TaxID=559629 RepID=UPI003D97D5AA